MTFPQPFKDFVPPLVVAQPTGNAVDTIKPNTPDENAATKKDADGDYDGNTDKLEKARLLDRLRGLHAALGGSKVTGVPTK